MKDSTKSDREPQPMDATAVERATAEPLQYRQRVCYAIRTLVAEVHEMFPETPVEFSNFNGRNVALSVAFDLTALDQIEADDLTTVLCLLDHDTRVESVVAEEGQVLVSMHNSARTQDHTDEFGILDALAVMDEPVDFMGGASL